jgi:hypothetical protein
MSKAKKDTIQGLIQEAIKQLQLMLKNPDERVRLRAISIILRHSERISLSMKKSNDPLSLELDSVIADIEKDLKIGV